MDGIFHMDKFWLAVDIKCSKFSQPLCIYSLCHVNEDECLMAIYAVHNVVVMLGLCRMNKSLISIGC